MYWIFGKLTPQALPHEWFTIGGAVFMTLMGILTIVAVTYFKKWRFVWNYLTTTDPKKIGVMYIIFATLMLLRGGLDAIMIWLQQAMALSPGQGYLDAIHFQEIFTAHGDIMVFFVTMGFLFGLINIVVPLQIGARDLASPFLNTLGFWLYVAGGVLINVFFVFGGQFAAAGWLSVAPLSGIEYSPGVGMDYWIWALQISGLGTLLGGINFVMTILKMRPPGMTLMRMPMFTWTSLCSMIIVICIFPILTMTLILLNLDRLFGTHFFTTTHGGNPMMYTNLIWTWGHPEVYVLVLPLFGAFSEIVSTFSQKKLFSYKTMVASAITITVFSMLVWLHHFFTMGASANINAFFGMMTVVIAVPTSMQVFVWISTMYKGKIVLKTPMLWFIGFLLTFGFGGLAGVLMAVPPADFQVHNSLFLVAHFHTMAVGGALFGIFAAFTYWFPKITGFMLDERLGRYSFFVWITGFFVAFSPLYILGLMGATRRLDTYSDPTWQPFFITALVGGIIIGFGFILQILQVAVSIKNRKKNPSGADPWNARTLEWSVPSPAPFYNFAEIPVVKSIDAFWEMKKSGEDKKKPKYEDFHTPKNTSLGIFTALFCFIIGFAMVWHIFWLAILALIGAIAMIVIRSFDDETEYLLSKLKVQKIEEDLRNG